MAGKKAEHADLTLAEAAAAAGISKQTAHAAERRALAKIRQAVEHDSELLEYVIEMFGCVPDNRR